VTVVEEGSWIKDRVIVYAGGLLPVMASILQALSEFGLGVLHFHLHVVPIALAVTAVLRAVKL